MKECALPSSRVTDVSDSLVKRISLIAIFVCLSFFTHPAASHGENWSWEERADSQDENALVAKEKAIAKAQKEATLHFLRTLAPQADVSFLQSLAEQNFEACVTSFELKNEKMSGVRYRATVLVHFNKDNILSLLTQNNIAYSTERIISAPLLIPALQPTSGQPLLFFGETQGWDMILEKEAHTEQSPGWAYPLGDLADTQGLQNVTPEHLTGQIFANLLTRYDTDNGFLFILTLPDTEQAALMVTLYEIRPRKIIPFKHIVINSEEGVNLSDRMTKAAQRALALAKAESAYRLSYTPSAASDMSLEGSYVLQTTILVKSLEDWLKAKVILDQNPYIKATKLKSLTSTKIIVDLTVSTPLANFLPTLEEKNLQITKKSEQAIEISFTPYESRNEQKQDEDKSQV